MGPRQYGLHRFGDYPPSVAHLALLHAVARTTARGLGVAVAGAFAEHGEVFAKSIRTDDRTTSPN